MDDRSMPARVVLDDSAGRHLKRIANTLQVAAWFGIVLLVGWLLRDLILLVFVSILLACILRGSSDDLHEKTGISQGFSLLVVVTGVLVFFGTLVWWRGPVIASEAGQIVEELTSEIRRVWSNFTQSPFGAWVAQQLQDRPQSTNIVTGYAPGIASSVLGLGGTLVVIIATGLFLAVSPQSYLGGALRILPPDWRPRAHEVANETGATLQRWFLGQLVDMAIVGSLVGLGLYLLEVPLAMTLAIFAALLNFVPYVGAIAGAVPAVVVAFAQSPTLALWVALLFVAVQTLEGNVIAPLIQKRTVYLPPALTIISQTVFGSLFGIFGLVVATPLAAAALVFVRMVHVEGLMEKDHERPM